jgi:hypothetical protein
MRTPLKDGKYIISYEFDFCEPMIRLLVSVKSGMATVTGVLKGCNWDVGFTLDTKELQGDAVVEPASELLVALYGK